MDELLTADDIDYVFGEDGDGNFDIDGKQFWVAWSHDEENEYGDVVLYLTSDLEGFDMTLTGVYNRISYEDSDENTIQKKAEEISQSIADAINRYFGDK